jgi:hypothetical protein
MNSINSTTLLLRDYEIKASPGSQEDVASFTVFNPGPGDFYAIGEIPVIDDGAWHKCQGGRDSLPWQLLSCDYMLDRSVNKLGFRFQWYCDDRDPYNAYVKSCPLSEWTY